MSFQAFFGKIAGILRAEIHSKARKCDIFAIKVHKCGIFMTKVHKCDICCIEHAQNHENTGKITKIHIYMGDFPALNSTTMATLLILKCTSVVPVFDLP